MHILSAANLSLEIAGKELFRDLSFGLEAGEKVGLIGVNGCGKSSLLRILAGELQADSGQVNKRRNLRLAWSAQNLPQNEDEFIRDFVYQSGSPRLQLIREYQQKCNQLAAASGPDASAEALQRLQQELDGLNVQLQECDAWGFEQQLVSVLKEFGIDDMQLPISSLSGGMRKKLALARSLVDEADLLLLDEPTNHLDAFSVEWLESYVKRSQSAVILVTHDRYLLEVLCDRILEIDDKKIYSYPGSWQTWLGKRAEREAARKQMQAGALRRLKGELDWLRRQPKARGTKSKSRMERAQALEKQAAQGVDRDHTRIVFESAAQRTGKRILTASNLGKAWDEQWAVRKFDYHFKQNERIGIIGPNGCGKSTLLGLLVQRIKPDEGSVSVGVNTSFGVFDQFSSELPGDVRVMDYVRQNFGNNVQLADGTRLRAEDVLEQFYFNDSLRFRRIKDLSGGERRRLQLVQVLLANPNFLVLDEPGNDLDIQTLTALENYLADFQGCVLAVSHDRYFLDRLASRLLVFDSQRGIYFFEGNYTQWLESEFARPMAVGTAVEEAVDEASANGAAASPVANPGGTKKKRFSYKEKREFEALESEIADLEEQSRLLNEQLQEPGSDFQELGRWGDELQQKQERLQWCYERWQELAESVEDPI